MWQQRDPWKTEKRVISGYRLLLMHIEDGAPPRMPLQHTRQCRIVNDQPPRCVDEEHFRSQQCESVSTEKMPVLRPTINMNAENVEE